MSQEIREKALSAAVTVAGGQGIVSVLKAASAFEAYIIGDSVPKVLADTSASEETTKSPVPAAKVGRPAGTKNASGSSSTASASKKAASEPAIDMKKVVGDKVNELLKANKRSEAVELLASFNGAKSATGVIEQGEEIVQMFLVGADAILMAE